VNADIQQIRDRMPPRALVEAELMSRKMHPFVKGSFHVLEPGRKFQDNWHIGAICEVLEAVTTFELRSVVINIPFRSMKSLLVNVQWPAWVWARAPHTRWLCVAGKEDLSVRDSIKCRRLIESDWYQRRWGHAFALTSDQNQKTKFENDKTGYRMTGSVGASVIGEGGDYRVIDDPHKTDTQESDAVREGKLVWLREEFSSRFIDPERNALVLIMQRLNDRDMAGYMLAEQWADYHLCIPMRYESRRRVYIPPVKH
jgi:hypothetical protein